MARGGLLDMSRPDGLASPAPRSGSASWRHAGRALGSASKAASPAPRGLGLPAHPRWREDAWGGVRGSACTPDPGGARGRSSSASESASMSNSGVSLRRLLGASRASAATLPGTARAWRTGCRPTGASSSARAPGVERGAQAQQQRCLVAHRSRGRWPPWRRSEPRACVLESGRAQAESRHSKKLRASARGGEGALGRVPSCLRTSLRPAPRGTSARTVGFALPASARDSPMRR